MLMQEFTPLYPPLQVRAGVLVVDGFGVRLRVLHGKLRVGDGLGRQRRSIVLDRAGSGLERLVLIGKTGSVTLEAFAWLRAIGAAFVQIGRDGELLAHSIPFGYDGLPIRRAQAIATKNGFDLTLARDLIGRKLEGQHRNLARLNGDLRRGSPNRSAGRGDSLERLERRFDPLAPSRSRTHTLALGAVRFEGIGAHWSASRFDPARELDFELPL